MLARVTGSISTETTRMRIFYAAVIIFAFRATPAVGRGLSLVHHRRAGIRRGLSTASCSRRARPSASSAAWLLSDAITRQPVTRVLLWLTILGGVLSLPTLALVFRLHEWTERLFGFGARSIALFDAAAASPLASSA